jgi:hypothetical protein
MPWKRAATSQLQRTLRAALKVLLRRFGLRAISIEQAPDPD